MAKKTANNDLHIALIRSPKMAEAATLPERASRLTIIDKATHNLGLEMIKIGKEAKRVITGHYDKIIGRASFSGSGIRAALTTSQDMEKADLSEVEAWLGPLVSKATDYTDAQERREQAEADRQRIENERIAKAQRDKELAELKAREDLTRAQMREAVKTVKAAPLQVASPVVESQLGHVAGTAMRTTYGAEVFSPVLFRAAFKRDQIPNEAMIPDQVWLNAQARSNPKLFEQLFPGCKLVTNRTVAG